MTRSAVRSRRRGSGPANCLATVAAEATSMTESRPNAISAIEEAIVPAVSATRRGGHDVLAGAAVVPAVARVAAHDRVAGLGQQPFRAPQQVDQLVGHARPRAGRHEVRRAIKDETASRRRRARPRSDHRRDPTAPRVPVR